MHNKSQAKSREKHPLNSASHCCKLRQTAPSEADEMPTKTRVGAWCRTSLHSCAQNKQVRQKWEVGGGLDGEECGKEHGKGIFLEPRITASSKQEEGLKTI